MSGGKKKLEAQCPIGLFGFWRTHYILHQGLLLAPAYKITGKKYHNPYAGWSLWQKPMSSTKWWLLEYLTRNLLGERQLASYWALVEIRAGRNQCGLSICGPDTGWAGEVRGSLGQGVELRARVGAHHGGLKIFEHRRRLNIASTLGVPRLVSVSASVSHSPASPGGENESSGGQRWWRDGQTLHSPQVTQMESPRSRAALQGEMSPFLQ